jgi:hypothetical protein
MTTTARIRTSIFGTECKLTGVGFCDLTGITEGVSVLVAPEAGNEHDPNALAVLVTDPGGQFRRIGYIPAAIATRIAATPGIRGRLLNATVVKTRHLPDDAYDVHPVLQPSDGIDALAVSDWVLTHRKYNPDGTEKTAEMLVPRSELSWTGKKWRAAHSPVAGLDIRFDTHTPSA